MVGLGKDKDYRYSRFSIPRDQLPLPADLETPVNFMDSYLGTLRESSADNERKILQYKKIVASRRERL